MALSILSLAIIFAAGCKADANGPDDDVPVGLRVHLNGALVVRADRSDVEGHLHVHVGEYSGQFIVTAVNGAGNRIDLPTTFRLAAQIDDENIARFVQSSSGVLQGEIVAVAAGETHLMLELWNGVPGTGTLAFAAAPIEVTGIVCEPSAGPADSPAACVIPTLARVAGSR